MSSPRIAVVHADARGFTLFEVVLSLVIFSMLTLMVYSAFFIGHRAVMKGERDAALNQRMRVAEDIFGRQVRSAVFYWARHEEEDVPFFVGRPDGMSFVTASPQARGGTGLAAVTYRVADGQLVLEERVGFTREDLYKPPRDAHVDRAVLLAGFTMIKFEYMPKEETANAEWQPNWDAREEDSLPTAVRLTIDGLEFFGHPWVREVPLMTISLTRGDEDFPEPEDEEEGEIDNGNDNTEQ